MKFSTAHLFGYFGLGMLMVSGTQPASAETTPYNYPSATSTYSYSYSGTIVPGANDIRTLIGEGVIGGAITEVPSMGNVSSMPTAYSTPGGNPTETKKTALDKIRAEHNTCVTGCKATRTTRIFNTSINCKNKFPRDWQSVLREACQEFGTQGAEVAYDLCTLGCDASASADILSNAIDITLEEALK